jgi:hypothetical protein
LAHSSFCSARTAPTRRMIGPRSGKIPTTSVRRRISQSMRSSSRPSWSRQALRFGSAWLKSVEVTFQSLGDVVVSLSLACPAGTIGVGLQDLDVAE